MNAVLFLVQTLFQLYILVVMLRFLFQLVRADFYNPLSQFIVKATNPPLVLLRRVIPGVAGIDFSAVVLMLLLQMAQFAIMASLLGASISVLGLFFTSLVALVLLTINVFFFVILIQVILSWVNPGNYNPIVGVLYSVSEPLLGPVRRLVPPISGFDLSPLIVIIGLRVIALLITDVFIASGLGQGLGPLL